MNPKPVFLLPDMTVGRRYCLEQLAQDGRTPGPIVESETVDIYFGKYWAARFRLSYDAAGQRVNSQCIAGGLDEPVTFDYTLPDLSTLTN